MRYLAVLIIVILSIKLHSQIVPGYRGKKGIISYQINISPALTRPTFLNVVRDKGNYPKATESTFITPFNVTHGLVLERVVGRKFAFAFDYNFVATKDYISFTQKVMDDQTSTEEIFRFQDAQVNIFGHYFTGSMVFYGKRSLAPYGKYFKLSIGHNRTFSSFTQSTYSSSPTSSVVPGNIYTFNTDGVHYGISSSNFGFSFGANRIYRNKIVVSRGFAYSFFVNPQNRWDDDNDAYEVMFRRMRGHDLLTIFLRIGFLV